MLRRKALLSELPIRASCNSVNLLIFIENDLSSVASQFILKNVNKNVKIIIAHKFYKNINIMIVNISGKYWKIWKEIPCMQYA